jgi:CubicO group peptidase (beta-lactamase class C family)
MAAMRLALLLVLCSAAAAADGFDKVREFIRKGLVEQPVPSIAVAVAKDGKILWEQGFGWADRENRVPATEHTMYSLASISKAITATGLMVLVERNQVDLEKPVHQYLGGAKLKVWIGNDAEVTVRRVANHSAGLPLHYQFFYADEPFPRPPMAESIRRYGVIVTPPGERYQYSNFGYGVLEEVIARVSGRAYEDFMRDEVFLPLGMNQTAVSLGPDKRHALRYGADNEPLPFYDFDHRGASAVYASAHNLVRFGMFHLKAHLADQKPILSDRAIAEMQEPTVKAGPGDAGYGIGWATRTAGKYRLVAHTGGMGGVTTVLNLVPAERLAVVVLCNARSNLAGRVANEIMFTLLPDLPRPPPATPQPEPVFKPAPELRGEWTGAVHTWKSETPLTLRFQEDGDIHARLGRQLWTLLNMVSYRDGVLSASMSGDVGTDDANRQLYRLDFTLKLRGGNILNGPVTALSLPGKRTRNALSYWTEVKKK